MKTADKKSLDNRLNGRVSYKHMKKAVTKRQKELLEIIYSLIDTSGYPPTFEEMKERLKVSSNQSVLDLLSKLENHKLIKRNEATARGLTILPLGYKEIAKPPLIPVLGSTSAGKPAESIEISGNWRKVSNDLEQLDDEVFVLKVHGDSMINAGIEDEDLVLVKADREFVSGNVVLANVNGETTIKRFISTDIPPYVYLKPENPNYPIIPITEEMKLIGKVVSLFKNNRWSQVS